MIYRAAGGKGDRRAFFYKSGCLPHSYNNYVLFPNYKNVLFGEGLFLLTPLF